MKRVEQVSRHIAPSPVLAKEYLFSKNQNRRLTEEQREFYEKNGFLVIRGLVSPEEIDVYTDRFLKISSGEVEKQVSMTMMRDIAVAKKKEMGESAITKLQDWQEDDVLFEYCKTPKIIDYVCAIIGNSANSVHTMLINKPPDVGIGSSRHPPHQDAWYFPFSSPTDATGSSSRIVCAWTAMQDIDKENGCLFVKPGSHTIPLMKHEYPSDGVVNKAYHGIQGLSGEKHESEMTHLTMKKGDCVFFHPHLIHGSGRNTSTRFRKAISCHYASSDCPFIEVGGTMQEDIAREVEEMAARKTKGMVQIKFADIWRMKSRLIVGSEGRFHED